MRTPQCVVAFLSGTLPATAELHLRQFSLFIMVAHKPTGILHSHAVNILTCEKSASKSWFKQVRDLSLMYGLPHPLLVLHCPPSKEAYKKLVRARVTDYWECRLRDEAKSLSSLTYFKPGHMSLKFPHPMFTTATTPYESCKAVVQARMVSGRYRTEELCRH